MKRSSPLSNSKKSFINNFSLKSREYSFSRPTYPEQLFRFFADLVPEKNLAWDCATGNGQAAIELCKHFQRVIASDASENQIRHRFARENIEYRVFPAEETPLADNSVDLVTVAQAVHWFDLDKFYSEVKRVGKNKKGGQEGRGGRERGEVGSIIAVWSYDMHKVDPDIDKIFDRLDVGGDILGKFWPAEIRRYVKQHYRTIPFPFEEIGSDITNTIPEFKMETDWNLYQLLNYMETWSAVKRYRLEKKSDPLDIVRGELERIWGDGQQKKRIVWKLGIRIGIIN